MSDDIIYDKSRYEYSDKDKASIDFKVDTPKTTDDRLSSSLTVRDGTVRDFELRLGLLSQERYDSEQIKMEVLSILDEMDLPRHDLTFLPEDNDRLPTEEFKVKIGYDPAWGEVGYYQVHLTSHTFFPLEWGEERFIEFVENFVPKYIERMDWETGDSDQ